MVISKPPSSTWETARHTNHRGQKLVWGKVQQAIKGKKNRDVLRRGHNRGFSGEPLRQKIPAQGASKHHGEKKKGGIRGFRENSASGFDGEVGAIPRERLGSEGKKETPAARRKKNALVKGGAGGPLPKTVGQKRRGPNRKGSAGNKAYQEKSGADWESAKGWCQNPRNV